MKINKDGIVRALDKIAAWSLYIIIFALPFGKSIVEISIAIGIVSIVLKKVLSGERLVTNTRVEIFLYIFVLASGVSLLNTQASQMAFSLKAFFSKTLKFAALFLIAEEVIDTRERLKDFITIAAVSCVVILADCFIQYFITHVDLLHNYGSFLYSSERPFFLGFPTASFPFQNDFAAWILMFIFPALTFAFFANGNTARRIIGSSLFSALAYALMLTKVKGAWAGFLFSLILLSVMKLKKAGWALLLVLMLAGFALNINNDIMSFKSIADRSVMWKNGAAIFMRHPVIGNGLNTFYDNYMKIRQDSYRNSHGSYAHNCYLQMAADTGLAGLVSFLLFVWALLAGSFRSLKSMTDPLYYPAALGLSLGISAFLIHSAVDTNLYSLPLAALFWLSAGILMATVRMSRKNT